MGQHLPKAQLEELQREHSVQRLDAGEALVFERRPPSERLKFVCVSDTHSLQDQFTVPDGDVLLHAGDFSGRGKPAEIEAVNAWLGRLPHKHKIVIAGNHDFLFEKEPKRAQAMFTNCTYLQDSAVTVGGLKIYGSPWQPWFFDWAFNLQRGEPLRKVWRKIPDDADIVITHGPPALHGDMTSDGVSAGCEDLLRRMKEVKPMVHLFGHIHEGYGITRDEHTTYINASTCTLRYRPINPPIVFYA